MRILKPEEFIKEPYGTVYVKYVPHMFIDSICIKSEPRGEEFGESWWATSLLPWVEAEDSEDESNILREWEESGSEYNISTEGFCTDDAIYNYKDNILYAVFDKNEVKGMINRLVDSLMV